MNANQLFHSNGQPAKPPIWNCGKCGMVHLEQLRAERCCAKPVCACGKESAPGIKLCPECAQRQAANLHLVISTDMAGSPVCLCGSYNGEPIVCADLLRSISVIEDLEDGATFRGHHEDAAAMIGEVLRKLLQPIQ